MLGTTGAALTYGTVPLLGIFSDCGFADAVLQFERALLQVEEELGLVPLGEAEKLALFQSRDFDIAAASAAAASTSSPVVGLVEQLQRISPYAHFGVTSHDAWDVAHVLQLRSAIKLILGDVRVVVERLADLTETHATTVMVARTQGQTGAPTTLGFKVATWLDELLRAAERLTGAMEDAALITIAGVVGTASSFTVLAAEPKEVEARVARILGLNVSTSPWFTSRDRFVALAAALGQLSTLAGKVGHEVYNLQRTGIEELAEGGAFGSLATPQKTNPWLSQKMHGLGVIARNLSSAVADSAALPEGEREIGTAYAEWYGLAQLCLVSGRLASDLAQLIGHLEVHEETMRANLDRDPAALSEGVSMILLRAVGKKRGYALMKAAMARYRAGASYSAAVSDAFRQAGVVVPTEFMELPGALGWAPNRARDVAAAARQWLEVNPP